MQIFSGATEGRALNKRTRATTAHSMTFRQRPDQPRQIQHIFPRWQPVTSCLFHEVGERLHLSFGEFLVLHHGPFRHARTERMPFRNRLKAALRHLCHMRKQDSRGPAGMSGNVLAHIFDIKRLLVGSLIQRTGQSIAQSREACERNHLDTRNKVCPGCELLGRAGRKPPAGTAWKDTGSCKRLLVRFFEKAELELLGPGEGDGITFGETGVAVLIRTAGCRL